MISFSQAISLRNNVEYLFQNEVIRDDVYITKPSLYRMVLRYMNLNNETVQGQIKITPESQSDSEQAFAVAFKRTRTPAFVTVSSPGSGIPSPLVMNPGTWTVSIKSQRDLFVVSTLVQFKSVLKSISDQ